MQDCINCMRQVSDLNEREQKNGTKGQWKWRARMQDLGTKESGVGEI